VLFGWEGKRRSGVALAMRCRLRGLWHILAYIRLTQRNLVVKAMPALIDSLIHPISAAQGTTVHDGLLHPHLRHCSSAASVVRRLPSAVRTATPAFDVRSSGLVCSRPGGLELVTRPAGSVTFL